MVRMRVLIQVETGMEKLTEIAVKIGASSAKIIDVKDVVVDERVRLKCAVPRCHGYGNCLVCPPHTMSVPEFREILKRYKKALVVQIESHLNSLDKSENSGLSDPKLIKEQMDLHRPIRMKFNDLMNNIEKEAFKLGFPFAAAFGAGKCDLCGEAGCLGMADGICRHPFSARPAMEGMGIDVTKTALNAGLSVELSSATSVKYTGLMLLE